VDDSNELVSDMAQQLFDCLRNVYLCLAVGDPPEAGVHLDEARQVHARLELVAQGDSSGFVGRSLLAVLHARITGLDALIGEGRAAH
jgi:hypothetical protein